MENVRPQRKILRSPSVKRKSKVLPVNQRVQLERVLGLTVSSNSGLSCDSNNGTIAYPAGCVTVLFNPRRNKQTHIFNSCKKTVTAVAFSPDGKHLVTGETGHQPAVRVWDVAEKVQIAEFHGHRFGISCVAFSPNMKEVVSVGTQHDMMVNVWNWKTNIKVASNKISSKVSAVAYAGDGSCFITVGNRLVKFWYLEDRRSKINQTVPLRGRSGILQEHKDNFFCDVAAGVGAMCGHFFVITQSGLLCEFNEKRQLDKWVELRTKSANCITAGVEHIFVGCAEGVVRVFSASSLYYLCSLPKPHHLGVEVTTATSPSSMVSNTEGAKYPDTMAIGMDDDNKKVTCVYNDRSIYIWDVHDLKRVGKAWSFLYHSGCIWALEVYPPLEDGVKARLPPGSFLTASGDDTIRVWNLNTHMPEDTAYKRNIYSNELLKIVYSDPTLTNICNVDYNPAGAADKTDTNYDGKNGVRSIRVSPDGADLASGDRQGNIRIYDMAYLNEKKAIEAHESDVMCLEYSYSKSGNLLATASRDRLIHVFDVDENYGLIQTLGDHSSSITSVRFTDNENRLRMISCGADKSILMRNAVSSPDFQFQLDQHLATKITLYDMVIDPTQKILATACQDRNVRLYNIQTTKEKKCYRGSVGDEGILLRIHLDPSGSFAATSCTDKNVCILDFHTGEPVATMYGHSEVITGVKFANDLKHIITVSADGCIFVWRLPSEMTNQIKGRLMELGKKMKDTDFFRSDQPLMPNPVELGGLLADGNFPVMQSGQAPPLLSPDDDSMDGREDEDDEDDDGGKAAAFDDTASQVSLDYRFSIGQLPNWAKAKFNNGQSGAEGEASGGEEGVVQPKGRWAQRMDLNVEFKSQLDLTQDEDMMADRRRSTEANSQQLADLRRETVVLGRQLGNKNLPVIGDDKRVSSSNVKSRRGSSPARVSEKSEFSLSKHWSDKFEFKNSLDLDDTDDLDTGSDTTEVIYPPNDGDSDLYASTYRVFGLDQTKKTKAKSSLGNVSALDDASESTDPVSLEDEDDPNDETLPVSNPTTPSDPDKDFLPRSPKEDFVRENFEEDSFTPIPMEKFKKNVEKLEHQMLEGTAAAAQESMPFSPRLSLSARFMSRSQASSFKGVSGLTGSHRPDNWFSRNKMEMARAMDETRKSLLAMNLRSESLESNSPEREDPPSPPTKLDQEEDKFPDVSKPGSNLSSSPPTGNTSAESRLSQGPKDSLQRFRTQSAGGSLGGVGSRVTPPTISSPASRRINQERERRRSSTNTPDHDERPASEASDHSSSDASSTRPVTRTRPTYFKTTQSSRSKVSRSGDFTKTEPAPAQPADGKDLLKKKMRRSGRLPGSKLAMYASTPNLLTEEEDRETKPKKNVLKFTSTSNLKFLSDLSKSVPDVNDADASTDSSSGGSDQRQKPGRKVLGNKTAWGSSSKLARDQQLMPPPSTVPASQGPMTRSQGLTGERRSLDPPRRKSSTSEMTLDQAKSILLGNSGILGKSVEQVAPQTLVDLSSDSPSPEGKSPMQDSALSSMSSTSTLTPGVSPPAFEPSPPLPEAKQLAYEQEIEHTANMLRQQQSNLTGAFSPEHMRHQSLRDMEATPLDLPERDEPAPSAYRTSPKQVSGSPSQKPQAHRSSPMLHTMPAKTSQVNSTFLVRPEKAATSEGFEAKEEESEESASQRSVRERIAMYARREHLREGSPSAPVSQTVRSASPYRRSLPASPNVGTGARDTSQSQSDTGVGSESDTDPASLVNSGTYSIGTNHIQETTSPKGDRSKLSLSITTPNEDGNGQPSSSQLSVTQCQSLVSEFKGQLKKLTDLYTEIEFKADETSTQVLQLLGSTIHDAHSVLSELSLRSQKVKDPSWTTAPISVSSSTDSSKTSIYADSKAFQHSSTRTDGNDSEASKTNGISNGRDKDGKSQASENPSDPVAVLEAAKDMLQPLVSQLSQDLSQELLLLIKDKLKTSE